MSERETFAAEPTVGVMCEPGAPPPPPPPAWQPPKGVTVKVLHGSLDGPVMVALVTLEPGAEWPADRHEDHQEAIVSFRDGAIVVVETLRTGAKSSTVVYPVPWVIGVGQPHSVRNVSSEPAEYISIMRRVRTPTRTPPSTPTTAG